MKGLEFWCEEHTPSLVKADAFYLVRGVGLGVGGLAQPRFIAA